MLPLGTPAPHFALPDIATGQSVALSDFPHQQALLVIFLCAHCPYVHHVAPELARLARDYADKNVAIIGITANDVTQYPQDAPAPTAQWAREAGLNFPVLFDESQQVAKAYTAACTPDFFLFGPERTLVYRGQLDDSRPMRGERPGRGELCGRDLRTALDAVLVGLPIDERQMPSIGCNIKWKPGNEPAYFG
jgi:peroxiredoxin